MLFLDHGFGQGSLTRERVRLFLVCYLALSNLSAPRVSDFRKPSKELDMPWHSQLLLGPMG